MTQKFKTSLKFLTLIFSMTFVLNSCEKEFTEDVEIKEISRFNIKTLNKSEINNKNEVINKLNKIKYKVTDAVNSNNHLREIYNAQYGFTINTNFVKYIEDSNNGNHSYSFSISRDNAITDKVENLVLHANLDGGYDAYLIEYGFTTDEYKNLSESPEHNYTTTVIPIDFDVSVFNDSELGKMVYGCTEAWSYITYTDHEGELHGVNSNGTCAVGCNYGTSEWVLTGISCGYYDDGSDSSGGGSTPTGTGPSSNSPSGFGSGGSNPNNNPIISIPIVIQPWEEIENCLNQINEDGSVNGFTPEMSSWLQNQPKDVIKQINDLLEESSCSQEVQGTGLDVINLMMANSNLTLNEALFEIGLYKIDDNGLTKIDPIEELECLDLSQGAKLVVYVLQANENSEDLVGANQVGHAFIGIEQNDIVRNLGFYPEQGASEVLLTVGVTYDSELRDNNNYPYHVSISKDISNVALTSIYNYIVDFPEIYKLNSYACVDFAIAVGSLGGLALPSTTVSSATFSGRTPGKLGQEIRAMTSNTEITITTTSANSPEKQGNCN